MSKTLLVGLDAACWDYLTPLLEQGELPNLNGMMQQGTWGTLWSTMPPWTPTAWSSIITGKNPGRHGVFDMLWRQPGTYHFSPTNAGVRKGTPFWKRLNEAGLRVGLVNIPFTYPPESIEGFLVCGFGSPQTAEQLAYPARANEWLRQNFAEYQPAVPARFLRSSGPDQILAAEIEHQAMQVAISCAMAREFPVDVLALNLMLPDHANHKMPDMGRIAAAYHATDEHLGQLLESFQPDNVLILSDHGSSRLSGDFLLNAWLRDNGYLIEQEATGAQRSRAINMLLMQYFREHRGWSGIAEKAIRRTFREILLRIPESLQDMAWAPINAAVPFAQELALLTGEPNFSKTPVFPGSVYSGLLYLNVMGREPNGIILKDHLAEYRAEIRERLLSIEEPDSGKPLFTEIYQPGDIYSGPAAAWAPDLILDSFDLGWNIRTSRHRPQVERVRNTFFLDVAGRKDHGWHSRDGIFVFAGPAFSSGPQTADGNVMDIPATLLHLHDVPVPDDYDGQVLLAALSAEERSRPVRYQSGDADQSEGDAEAYSEEEAEELVGHLRALGYLE